MYIDGTPLNGPAAKRVHKGNVIAKLEGVDDVNAAMLLKGKTVVASTGPDAELPEGAIFIGRPDRAWRSGTRTAARCWARWPRSSLPRPTRSMWSGGKHEYMIPAVDEFLVETNVEGGYIRVRLIEGM